MDIECNTISLQYFSFKCFRVRLNVPSSNTAFEQDGAMKISM